MVKKLKSAVDDDSLAKAVRASAAQIWQAGLGAFAKAQDEGSREFSRLVKDGAELQRGPGGSARTAGAGDKLEQVFEDRVARALLTIGVPDHGEVEELRRRVDQLAAQVERLSAALELQAAKPARKAAAKPAAKAVATKAPARKAPTR